MMSFNVVALLRYFFLFGPALHAEAEPNCIAHAVYTLISLALSSPLSKHCTVLAVHPRPDAEAHRAANQHDMIKAKGKGHWWTAPRARDIRFVFIKQLIWWASWARHGKIFTSFKSGSTCQKSDKHSLNVWWCMDFSNSAKSLSVKLKLMSMSTLNRPTHLVYCWWALLCWSCRFVEFT